MTEPAKKLSRTERLLSEKAANKPAAKQAQSPGKPERKASSTFRAPEQIAAYPIEKNKGGRPSSFNQDIADAIVTHIIGGGHMSKVKELYGLDPATIWSWRRKHEGFDEAVTRAEEARAELWSDQLIEIADTDEDANRARVRIDARWKVIGSLLYRRYGVKQSIDINQNVNVAVAHADALVRLANQAKQIETTYKDVTPT
jgi:hypothetical protein